MNAVTPPRVAFTADGRVQVRTGKVEIGQGLHTALAQIVADELGVALDRIDMLPVSTAHSPDEGVTAGSLSVQDAGRTLREACAALRSDSSPPAVRAAACGAVGTSAPNRGLPAKLAGRPAFIHDLQPEGLLHGRVLHPPRLGARLLGCDDAAVRALPGVLQVLRDGDLLGLVAGTSAQADAAVQALTDAAQWQVDPVPAEAADDLQSLPSTMRTVAEPATGTASRSTSEIVRTLHARYSKPWLAHASIAPSCALARWADSRLDVWTHSQGIFNLRRDLALAFALDPEAVLVHHAEGAGCYGHNGADDVAFDAAWLARAVHAVQPGTTVRVLWSRADELSHAPFGPAMLVDMQAGLDAGGDIVHWQHELWSPGHSRRPGRSATPALLGAWQVAEAFAAPPSIDMPLATGGGAERNAVPGYDFPAVTVKAHSVPTQRRSSAMRGLGAYANVFAAECFIDEIALATATCPLALRRRHLQHDPRALAVLNAAVGRSAWHPHGQQSDVGMGMAVARYKGTGAWCAVVAEVQAGATLRVHRLTIAVDVGQVVNPDGVVNQIEGGAIQATSWTLKEAAQSSHANWDDYPILRFSEVPAVDVLLMPSREPSLGAGEASIGPTAAAIANALFDALGVRVRDLPLSPEHIVAAMDP
jgi:CO/xanthine dehydrogenase Mo-binding subunit